MTLNDFFHSCKEKSSCLFREFVWILTEKFDVLETKLISGEHKISDRQKTSLIEWIQLKKKNYPIQYFIGNTQFMGEKFCVSERVLIPRIETEEISSWVVEKCKGKTVKSLIDIGSGSGCLGIGTAIHIPSLEKLVLLEPYGDESLSKNVESLCGAKSFDTKVVKKSFEDYSFDHKFDLILSNPPYIYFNDPDVAKGVYDYEPHEALFGGVLGWEKVIKWAVRSYDELSENGLLVFEISHDQKDVIEKKLKKYNPVIYKDNFGKDRFFSIEKN